MSARMRTLLRLARAMARSVVGSSDPRVLLLEMVVFCVLLVAVERRCAAGLVRIDCRRGAARRWVAMFERLVGERRDLRGRPCRRPDLGSRACLAALSGG
jgi:hypothetical protein